MRVNLVFAGLICATGGFGQAALAYDGTCSTQEDVTNLPPGMWCEVPESALKAFEKKPGEWSDWNGDQSASFESYQRVTGINGITAWSGAAFDTKRQRLLVFGGGHNNYGGNEIYAFSLESLTWERLSDPSRFPNRAPETQNNDGTPISRHTYGGLVYLDSLDSLFVLGGAPDSQQGGCGVSGAWLFDLAARERATTYSPDHWSRWSGIDTLNTGCDDEALYDPSSNRILYQSRWGWFSVDLASQTWSKINGREYEQGDASSTIAMTPGGERIIIQLTSGDVNGYRRLDLDGPSLRTKVITTSGDSTPERSNDPGLEYDEVISRVVSWAGGPNVYALDLSANVWHRLEPAPGNVANPGERDAPGGTFGRFQKSDRYGVYVAMDLVTENVYLYRLDAAQLGIQEASLPKPPSNLRAQ